MDVTKEKSIPTPQSESSILLSLTSPTRSSNSVPLGWPLRGGLGFFVSFRRHRLHTAIRRGIIDLTADACKIFYRVHLALSRGQTFLRLAIPPMTPCSLLRRVAILTLVSVVLLLGCENTVEPFAREAGPYSVYGALALHQDRHFIRVKPFQTPLTDLPQGPLPATVTLTNQSSGRTVALRDSVMTLGDLPTHNFHTRIDLKPETTYRLRVEGPDGAATEAVTLTPGDRDATFDTVGTASYPTGPPPYSPTNEHAGGNGTRYRGASPDTVDLDSPPHCLTRFAINLQDHAALFDVSVGFRYKGNEYWIPQKSQIEQLDTGHRGFKFVPQHILSHVEEDDLDDRFTCQYYEGRCPNLSSGTFRVAYTYLGPEWYGNRPSDELRNPVDWLQSTQIQDGTGFFGSYYRDTVSVNIRPGVVNLGPDACDPKP